MHGAWKSRSVTTRVAARNGIRPKHRLFSYISLNWAGKPLRTFETLVRYLRGTTTRTGLEVTASLCRGGNETGERVSDEMMKQLRLEKHTLCPQWNYTLSPRDLDEWSEEEGSY
jgi:hypothetical protein